MIDDIIENIRIITSIIFFFFRPIQQKDQQRTAER